MDNYLKIVSLTRNEYMYNIVKTKRIKNLESDIDEKNQSKQFVPNKKIFGTVITFVLMLTLLFTFKYVNISELNYISTTATYIQNPISPLFSDMGDIVFTNGLNIVRLKDRKLNFVVPVRYDNANVLNKSIEFEVSSSPVLIAIEDGVVSDIYIDQNNIKCVKIKHTKDVVSILKNVDILGVHIGAVIEKGKNIGTVKLPSKISVSIEVKGVAKSLSINGENICVN